MSQTLNSNPKIASTSPDANSVLGQALNGLLATEVDTTAGAIALKSGYVILNAGSALAMTLAAPIATTDDFKELTIISVTTQAHTVTTPSTKLNGTSIATFANKGDSVSLVAYQGVWYTASKVGVVIS